MLMARVSKIPSETSSSTVTCPRTPGRRRVSCGLLLLLAVVGFFLVATWLAAASGLVSIPLLSTLAFRSPAPLRQVEPGRPVPAEAALTLGRQAVRSRLQERFDFGSTSDAPEGEPFVLTISENSLTASLRDELAGGAYRFLDADRVQAAVDTQGIELFLPFARPDPPNAVRVRIRLEVRDGNLAGETTGFEVGGLAFPAWLAGRVFHPILAQRLAEPNAALARVGILDTVRFEEGSLVLEGRMVPVKE